LLVEAEAAPLVLVEDEEAMFVDGDGDTMAMAMIVSSR
jgi:hypothetical protein